ncbi:MAG: hypothetical protein AAF936_17565 [Pseudomonadota bacterium]
MPLDTLDQITHPDKNPASPRDISEELRRLSNVAFQLQGQSLVVQQQAELSALNDPTHIASYAGYAQANVKKHATYYLNLVLPGILQVVSSVDAVNNIVQAFATVSDDPNIANNPGKIAQLCELVSSRVEDVHKNALQLYQETQINANSAGKNTATLKGVLMKTIATLDNEDGQLTAASTAISNTESAIQRNIQEIIDNANVIGDGLKDFFMSIVTTISGNSKKDEPADPPTDKDKDSDDNDKDDGDDSASNSDNNGKAPEFKSFPVESISTTSSGVKGISEARHALDENFKRLGVLYQDFAELNAILSVAKAISEQTGSFSALYEELTTVLSNYTKTLGIVSGNFKALAANLKKVNADDVAFIHLKTKIRVSSQSWTRVSETTREIEAAMAGVASYFRPPSIIDSPNKS